MTSSQTEDCVVRSGFRPEPDGVAWRPWFKVHRPSCKYAEGAYDVGIYLDLWGRPDWDVMVSEGRVGYCKVCRPAVLP